jgi:hypothetical protein
VAVPVVTVPPLAGARPVGRAVEATVTATTSSCSWVEPPGSRRIFSPTLKHPGFATGSTVVPAAAADANVVSYVGQTTVGLWRAPGPVPTKVCQSGAQPSLTVNGTCTTWVASTARTVNDVWIVPAGRG